MAQRRRKKGNDDDVLFLFSEEEMIGKIENVTIINTAVSSPKTEEKDNITEYDVISELAPAEVELFSDDRMVKEMTSVLLMMASMDMSRIRQIAMTTIVRGQQGVDLSQHYHVPAIRETEISGYELAAWCYCCFVAAFPTMKDKLQMPYYSHYEKAKANLS